MGTIYQTKCPCGFEQDMLMEGCGMAEPDTIYGIQHCDGCHQFFQIHFTQEDLNAGQQMHCPQCGKVTGNLGEELEEGLYQCSACGETKLQFYTAGLWD